MTNINDYLTAIDLIFTFYASDYYSNDEIKIRHLLRVSNNPNLINMDERISCLLYTTIIDGYLTQSEIETQFNTNIATNVSRINQYPDETEYTYIDRINSNEVLSRMKYCILEDNYYIDSYNSKTSLVNANSTKSLINMNYYKGYGCQNF